MEIAFSLVILAVYLIIKKYGKNIKPRAVHFTYKINEGLNIDDLVLTDKQLLIYNYLSIKSYAYDIDIIKDLNTTNVVINNLHEKGVIEKMSSKKLDKREIIILAVSFLLLILSAFLINYFVLVRVNLRYIGIFIFIAFHAFIGLNLINYFMRIENELLKRIIVFASSGFFVFVLIFYIFGGRPFLHAEEYSKLIEVNEESFVEDINTVDINTLPIVDKSYGAKLGSLKLGEYTGIGSEFQPGDYSDIIYQGKQYLVAPLEYRGFFKWSSNNDVGTPGYILIDKVTSETTLVNLRESSGEGMKFVPSAFFSQDLQRHAYYNGLSKYRLENIFFEIDEERNPYYIMQYSLPTVFINGGDKINKIAVVNAMNGDVNIYEPTEVPSWVESVYPSGLIFEHLNYWGSLQDGWLNSVFAQKGVLQTSTGTRVIMNEGELFYFTGLTSAGNDESTVGFVYANMRTKEPRLFRFSGATEEAAMNKALTLIPQNNISTSFPIPLNVQDTPTYFILIKGEDGRILRYVFIKIQDLEFYTIAEVSKADAYNRYSVKLNEDDDTLATEVTGVIDSISSYVVEGNTVYWIEVENNLYMINVANFTSEQMQYFISKDVGDSIDLFVVDYTVIDFGE
ncbi:MAG: hypothetical protein RQ856_02230 [Candidatus Izemoplasmatales bacterium]|nr:hypothetical protein [Candidatus Izemoplasmatales bacterium]